MAGEWPTLSLRDANVTLIDCDHRTPPASEAGYPYVAIPQLRGGRVDLSDVRRITREHLVEWTRKAKPSANDVILSRRCNPGETAVVPSDLEFALGQNLVLLRADGTKVYPPFLRWLVRGPEWWDQIAKFLNVGAVFDSLRCADVPKFELRIPPCPEQRAIAHILGTLDDKIELNRRMNETLETTARALFENGLARAVDRALAPVEDLIRSGSLIVGDGYRAKNEELGPTGLPFVRAGDLFGGNVAGTADHLRDERLSKATGKISEAGDVAFTSKGTVGRFAFVHETTPRFVYSPPLCYWRVRDRAAIEPVVLYRWMLSPEFVSQLDTVKGQTDMADYVSLRDQRRMTIALPPIGEQRELAKLLAPIERRIELNRMTSLTLAALRDTLLPKLISGEIRIRQAEHMLERTL